MIGYTRCSLPESDSSPDSLDLGITVAGALNIRSSVEDISPTLIGAGCYQRRDDSVRMVVPEFGTGYKLKIALPGILDANDYSIFSVVVQSPSGKLQNARLTPEAYLGIVAATNFQTANPENDGVLLCGSVPVCGSWHPQIV